MQRLFLLILVASAVGGYMQYIHNPEPVAASDQTQIAWEPSGHLRPSPWSTAGQGSGFTVQTVVAPAGTADFQTGMSYRRAGGDINNREAAKCFLQAARQGHAQAMFELGYMYERGDGVSQEYRKAAAMYKHAADKGHQDAQEKLRQPDYAELLQRPDTWELDPLK